MISFASETQLLEAIVGVARRSGWMAYHTFDSRRSEPGFPDLVLVKGDVILFLELKMPKGKVTEAQQRWLDAIDGATRVATGVVRPENYSDLFDVLTGVTDLVKITRPD